jgi:peptidoglycan/xylan/chitin deacetylase (PgdA/CDA1 family)
MKAISESIDAGEALPHNNVAITIDDGYRDFFLYAYPVFRDYQIYPTVFVISDFLDQKLWPWWNQIEWAFEHTAEESVSISFLDGKTENMKLETQAQRLCAIKRTVDTLITVGNTQRIKLMELIPEILKVTVPTSPPSKWSPLGWDEVRQMVRDGVEIAGHTKTHPILSRISDAATLLEEIEGSKQRIEEELDQPVIHFSYPNGKLADFTKQTVEIVKSCGFRTALTSERGLNLCDADPFLLRRIGVEPDGATCYFQELLAGIVDAPGAKTSYSSLK